MDVVIALEIYVRATRLATKSWQVVGEKSDYYITLAQLEQICQDVTQEHVK
jgi:hypothetical protein